MVSDTWSFTDPSTWQWADAQQIVATTGVVTLILLAIAAVFTGKQLRLARNARRERDRPFVTVDIEIQAHILFRLVLRNLGKTSATDVSLSFDPSLTSTLDNESKKVKDVPFLNGTISTFHPGKSFGVLFDRGPDRASKRDEFPDRYEVQVRYWGIDGGFYDETQIIDLADYWDKPDLNEHDLHDVHDQLDRMRRSLVEINQAIRDLVPLSNDHFPPLKNAVHEPQSGQSTVRGMGGEGYPSGDASNET